MVDTNFAISHLSIVKGLVDRYTSSKSLVLIPWVVIQELDGLKSASSSYGQANLATLARNAVRYFYECLSSGTIGLRGQKMGESMNPGELGDDAILDCARYWHDKQGIQSVLLSNDKNLCTKIMIHGMGAISHEPGLDADQILTRVLENWDLGLHLDNVAMKSVDMMDVAQVRVETPTQGQERVMQSAPEEEAQTQTIDPGNASEMETDAIIAPFYSGKGAREDPFAMLASKAGASPYEKNSRQIPVRGSPPLSRHGSSAPQSPASPSKTRSASPMNDRQTPALTDLLRDVEATIIKAFPPLIRDQLLAELGDELSVEFLMQGEIANLQQLSKRIVDNLMTFGTDTLPRAGHQNAADRIKTMTVQLTQQLRISQPQKQTVVQIVGGWSDVWRALSKGIRDAKYEHRRDKYISGWTAMLQE